MIRPREAARFLTPELLGEKLHQPVTKGARAGLFFRNFRLPGDSASRAPGPPAKRLLPTAGGGGASWSRISGWGEALGGYD